MNSIPLNLWMVTQANLVDFSRFPLASCSLSILSPVGIYMLKWLLQMNSKRSNKLDVAVRKFILQFHENSIR